MKIIKVIDTCCPHPSAQLNQVIAIMRISDNWKQFVSNFNKMGDRKNGQLELDLKDLEYKSEPQKPVLSDFNQKLKKALNYSTNKNK